MFWYVFFFFISRAAAFVSISRPGLMWKLQLSCEYMCAWACLHQRRLLMKYDLWRKKKKKKFPVRVLLLELQSIIYLQVSNSSQQVLVC